MARNPIPPRGPQVNIAPLVTNVRVPNKRSIIAKMLGVEMRDVGISRPVTLFPGRGQLSVRGKVHLRCDGQLAIFPDEDHMWFKERASRCYVRLNTSELLKRKNYLFSASVEVEERTQFHFVMYFDRHHARARGGSSTFLEPGLNEAHTLVTPAGHNMVDMFLNCEADWLLKRVQVTPVEV